PASTTDASSRTASALAPPVITSSGRRAEPAAGLPATGAVTVGGGAAGSLATAAPRRAAIGPHAPADRRGGAEQADRRAQAHRRRALGRRQKAQRRGAQGGAQRALDVRRGGPEHAVEEQQRGPRAHRALDQALDEEWSLDEAVGGAHQLEDLDLLP